MTERFPSCLRMGRKSEYKSNLTASQMWGFFFCPLILLTPFPRKICAFFRYPWHRKSGKVSRVWQKCHEFKRCQGYRLIFAVFGLKFSIFAWTLDTGKSYEPHYYCILSIKKEQQKWYHFYRSFVERKTGFEPATFTLGRWRSTVEPFPRLIFI